MTITGFDLADALRSGTGGLSVGQERLWFLDQLEPGSAAYNVPLVLRLTGRLDVGALSGALDAVAARHEALRSRFPAVDGLPQVVVDEPAPVRLGSVDLRADGGGGRAAALAALTNRGFDLAAGPLLRADLLRTGEEEHLLCLVLHHIVADGWSLGLLRSELAHHYATGRGEARAALPTPASYRALAAAERVWLDGPEAARAREFWRDRLTGAPSLELPLDAPRTDGSGSSGAYRTQVVRGLGPELAAFARAHRVTPFMVLATAYSSLLHRITGQDDFCVGVPTAARDTVGSEGTIGYFSSALVLRADFSAAPTFGEALRRTRSEWTGALTHRRVPFERLAEDLRPARDTGRTPVFQTMLAVHTQDGGALGDQPFADLTCAEVDGGHRAVKFELGMDVRADGDDLHVVLGYRSDLLDGGTVAATGRRFETLLRGALADPGTPVHLLPLLDADDLARLAGAGRGPDLPAAPCVLPAIDRAAAARPDATAVVGPDGSLTRGELCAASRALAARLAAHGVGRGDVVALCLPRGPEAVTAMLAVWRLGAGYLPLDPAYPSARLAFVLADSGAVLLLTPDGSAPDGVDVRVPVLSASAEGHAAAGDPAGEPSGPLPDDPAYLIYTSGSTGRPKGVLVPHRALAARVAWMVDGYGIGEDDRVLQYATLAFDTSAEELFPALTAGAVLVTARPGAALPDQLAEPYAAGVTVLDLPTPYWHHLVADLDETPWPEGLRLLVLGADQVRPDAVAAWRARFGDRVRVVNSYGPTETTVIATTWELGAADGRAGRPRGGGAARGGPRARGA
ncbi:condensation domain-containing protein, partial [Kitasatospora phosalacinea]|uniref:non-ribosomal peptide synthetase n=1 Tax=Kitasatospora phosalacinea TaxID=2065 RepID=UPI00365F6554